MIRIEDLQEAIAECQGERHPNANTCIKLAAYYTILHELQGTAPKPEPAAYSYMAEPPDTIDEVTIDSDTEFAETVNGKDPAEVWPVIDDLMTAVMALHPKLYGATMRKLNEI